MNTHTSKSQENKSQSIANNLSVNQSENNTPLQQENNHPGAIQLQKIQEMANNSPQVKKAAQLQALADKSSAIQNMDSSKPIQRKLIYNSTIYSHIIDLIDVGEKDTALAAFNNTKEFVGKTTLAEIVNSANHYTVTNENIIRTASDSEISSASPFIPSATNGPDKFTQQKEQKNAEKARIEAEASDEIKKDWLKIQVALQNVKFSASNSWAHHMLSEKGRDDEAGITKGGVITTLNSLSSPDQIKKDDLKPNVYIHYYKGGKNIAFSLSSDHVEVFHVGPGGGNK